MNFSSVCKRCVVRAGLLPWWESHISRWPQRMLYHYVGDDAPPTMRDSAVSLGFFRDQIAALRKRYHFLSWPEYRQVMEDRTEAKGTLLLTFDDGFRASWQAVQELASVHGIPSVFFVNTRTLDNEYLPWHMQFYFLRREAGEKFLEPLWKSIGEPPSPGETRSHLHRQFSIESVVAPIEEGLKAYGMSPADVARRDSLFMASADLKNRGDLIEIGNHSHSHYILSRLSDEELDADLRASHEALKRLLDVAPECFAYPFGDPRVHFDARCLARLRRVDAYPHIFSAGPNPHDPSIQDYERNRISFEMIDPREAAASASEVSPRYLLKWIAGR